MNGKHTYVHELRNSCTLISGTSNIGQDFFFIFGAVQDTEILTFDWKNGSGSTTDCLTWESLMSLWAINKY